MIPHINLSSYAGGGKTTISKLLIEKYHTVVIPKITTRPRRPTDEIPEYIYVSPLEFEKRRDLGHFLAVEDIATNGVLHYHAIPILDFWPCIPKDTELILSVFGEQARQAQILVPQMKLVFIGVRDKLLLANRLRHRCDVDGGNFEKKWAQNERYLSTHFESNYDFVVYNDTTPQDCVEQITTLIMER